MTEIGLSKIIRIKNHHLAQNLESFNENEIKRFITEKGFELTDSSKDEFMHTWENKLLPESGKNTLLFLNLREDELKVTSMYRTVSDFNLE